MKAETVDTICLRCVSLGMRYVQRACLPDAPERFPIYAPTSSLACCPHDVHSRGRKKDVRIDL
jgi:hypothetical protein